MKMVACVKQVVYVAILVASLACCKKVNEPGPGKQTTPSGYKEYLIPKDQHSAVGNALQPVNKKEMRFMVRFDSSCIYTNRYIENTKDINKLYGFSDCSSLHHNNSARVGWLWNGVAIELHAYCYADSIRSSRLLGTVAINSETELAIAVQPQQYIFECNGKRTGMKRSCSADQIEGYRLYPYFGGDETAPHDIHVFIKELN